MDINTATLIGVIVALSTALGKIAEGLVAFLFKKKDAEKPTGDHQQVEKDVSRLIEWHAVKDQNGTFVWYFPRHEILTRFATIEKQLQALLEKMDDGSEELQVVREMVQQISNDMRRGSK